MKIKKLFLLIYLFTIQSFSQNIVVEKIEPPNWWSKMNYNEVQFMLYGNNLTDLVVLKNLSELEVKKVYNSQNSRYCFLDVQIPEIETSNYYKIYLANHFDTVMVEIPVLAREKCKNCYRGFNQEDVIYLITPDRFCNGDETNDEKPDYVPDFPFGTEMGRHGGDIQGIIDKLDYIVETGFTAIWINPLLENNGKLSYHGYAATDLYKVDERFGTNELYRNLVREAHKKGIKVIFDHINNHIGINHPWVNNLPFADWFNGTKRNHFITTHKKIAVYSSYSDQITIDSTLNGWFVEQMPDLNQRNPFVAKYLMQNMIWWIEYSGLDGIREDTYPYSDQKFLSEWNEAILKEYPNFNITGEVWIEEPAFLAPYQKNSKLNKQINTNLPSLIDFGLYKAIKNFLHKNGSINELYETLSKDFLYPDPNNLLTFADNHDIERVMNRADEDTSKFELAFVFLLTTRGIPQIYYGTEIGMRGGKTHGQLREEFPGGFPHHPRNAFQKSGKTAGENKIYNFFKKLLEIRSSYSSLRRGKLVHYPPQNEVYYYLKVYDNEKTLVVLNNGNHKFNLDLQSLSETIGSDPKLLDLWQGDSTNLDEGKTIQVDAKSFGIFLINSNDK